MKILITILFLPILLFSISYFSTDITIPMQNVNSVCFIVDKDFEGLDCIKNGDQYILTIYSDFENFYKTNKNNIKGFNLYFDKNFNINDFCKQIHASTFKGKSIDENQILYGYTNEYNDFRYVDGKKINMQIVINENEIVVGFPLILSGF